MASWGLTVQKGPWKETARDRAMAIRGANRHNPYSPRNTYNAPAVKASIDVIADIPYTPIAAIPEYYYNLLVPMSFIQKQNQGSVTDANPKIDHTVEAPKSVLNAAPSQRSSFSSYVPSEYSMTTEETDEILMEEYPFLRTIKEEDIPKVVDMERAYLQGIKLQASSYAQTENIGREITEELKMVYNDILESIAAVEYAAHGGPAKKEVSIQIEPYDTESVMTQTPKIPTRIMPGKRNQPHARRMESGVQTMAPVSAIGQTQTTTSANMESETQTGVLTRVKKIGTLKTKTKSKGVETEQKSFGDADTQTTTIKGKNKQTQVNNTVGEESLHQAYQEIENLKAKFDYAVQKYEEVKQNETALAQALENTNAAGNELVRQRDIIAEEAERRQAEIVALRNHVDLISNQALVARVDYENLVRTRDHLIEELGVLVRERENVARGASSMNYALAQDIYDYRARIQAHNDEIMQLQNQIQQFRNMLDTLPPPYEIVDAQRPMAAIEHDAPMMIEYQQEQLADQANIAEVIEVGGVVPQRRPASRAIETAYVKRERMEERQLPPLMVDRERLARPNGRRNFRSAIESIENVGTMRRNQRLQEFVEQGRQESLQRRFPPGPRGGSTIPKTQARQKPKVPPRSRKPGGGGRELRNIPGNPYRGPI